MQVAMASRALPTGWLDTDPTSPDFLATGAQLGMLGQGDTQSRTISSEIPIESYERSRPQNPERSRSPIERTSNRRSWTQQMNLTHLKNDNMK